MSTRTSNDPPRPTAERRVAGARGHGGNGNRPASTRFFEATPCEGPGCRNTVPAGIYSAQRKRSFCSDTCRNRLTAKEFVIGTCACGCGQPVLGRRNEAGIRKFTNEEHYYRFAHERQLGETGCFRASIESYMAGHAQARYKPGTLPMIQTAVAKFFRFVARQGIRDFNDVHPETVALYTATERDRGARHRAYISPISTFFSYLIKQGRYALTNPVVRRKDPHVD